MTFDKDREQFWMAIHLMRDAFLAAKQQAEELGDGFGALAQVNGDFFDGYAQAKRVFGNVLLHAESLGAKDSNLD